MPDRSHVMPVDKRASLVETFQLLYALLSSRCFEPATTLGIVPEFDRRTDHHSLISLWSRSLILPLMLKFDDFHSIPSGPQIVKTPPCSFQESLAASAAPYIAAITSPSDAIVSGAEQSWNSPWIEPSSLCAASKQRASSRRQGDERAGVIANSAFLNDGGCVMYMQLHDG